MEKSIINYNIKGCEEKGNLTMSDGRGSLIEVLCALSTHNASNDCLI